MPFRLRRAAHDAARHMAREWRVCGYQTTALVSEAYLKLVGQRDVDWQNRAHFCAIAAQVMRRILVDSARRDLRPEHGAGLDVTPLDEAMVPRRVLVAGEDLRASAHYTLSPCKRSHSAL